MQIDDVRRVAVIGAGTMGQQIAFQCAGHGYDVVVYDTDAAALDAASARIDTYADGLGPAGSAPRRWVRLPGS
jgi:3-hydroxybutyryl-CoA dehydrogenase